MVVPIMVTRVTCPVEEIKNPEQHAKECLANQIKSMKHCIFLATMTGRLCGARHVYMYMQTHCYHCCCYYYYHIRQISVQSKWVP